MSQYKKAFVHEKILKVATVFLSLMNQQGRIGNEIIDKVSAGGK